MAQRAANTREDWLTRRILAWAGFDVMSSVYIGIVPNVFFPVYFQRYVIGTDKGTVAWGMLVVASIVVSSMVALLVGALSSHIGRFRLVVGGIAALTLFLVIMALPLPFSLWSAALCFVAAQSCYFAATAIYESYLPDIAPAGSVSSISGFGWALGYVGGVVGTIVLLALFGGRSEDVQLYRMTFATVAAMTAVLATVVFIAMRRSGFADFDRAVTRSKSMSVWRILFNWKENRSIFVLISGTMLIHSATAVVLYFTVPILNQSFGQTYSDLLRLLLLLQALSIPTTYVSAVLCDRWSRKWSMVLLLSGWALILMLLAFARGAWIPWVIVLVLACCLGAINAVLRGFLAEAVDPRLSAAYFAISTMTGRLSSALGPLLFVLFTKLAGEQAGLMSALALLVAGGGIMLGYLRDGPAAAQAMR